jgi:hypothetical protein
MDGVCFYGNGTDSLIICRATRTLMNCRRNERRWGEFCIHRGVFANCIFGLRESHFANGFVIAWLSGWQFNDHRKTFRRFQSVILNLGIRFLTAQKMSQKS